MRGIIDEYMEEIKHANLANQPSVDTKNLASEPSSMINAHSDKHRQDEGEYKSYRKESVSDINKRYTRPEDDNKEKTAHIHGPSSNSRTRERTSPENQISSQVRSRFNEITVDTTAVTNTATLQCLNIGPEVITSSPSTSPCRMMADTVAKNSLVSAQSC
nr:hypothetical protein [Tanacetum cinerariifolium]GEW86994.1 hypothetical protein [Tanacetum cinerariifolium]